MAKHERQSLYYSEDNLYLYQYVKEKRKSNDWVIELIKREYMKEKGLVSIEPTPTQTPATPTMDQQVVELLTQQVQALAKQVADQQEMFLKTQQAMMAQPMTPVANQAPTEPVKETPIVSQPNPVEPSIEPVEIKPNGSGSGRLGSLKAKASKTRLG